MKTFLLILLTPLVWIITWVYYKIKLLREWYASRT